MDIKQARKNVIEQQIRPWGGLNVRANQALADIPRENFVPAEYQKLVFADIEIPAADVNVSSDASVATTITFDSPVYLNGQREYALILLSDSTEYTVWISRIGEADVTSTAQEAGTILVTAQPPLSHCFKVALLFLRDIRCLIAVSNNNCFNWRLLDWWSFNLSCGSVNVKMYSYCLSHIINDLVLDLRYNWCVIFLFCGRYVWCCIIFSLLLRQMFVGFIIFISFVLS